MTKIRFFSNILSALTIISFIIVYTGNNLYLFIDIFSLVLVIVIPYFIISFVFSPIDQIRFFKEIMKKGNSIDKKCLKQAKVFHKYLKNIIITCTVAVTIMKFIGFLAHLDDPAFIAPNFAFNLIAPFYGALYILTVVEPLRASIDKKLSE